MKALLTKRTFVLIILFLFSFLVRFAFISKGPFHYDALDLALSAQKTLATGVLHYEHGTGFPLTVICGAFFIFVLNFFGVTDPVFCVNLMSVVAGALGVLSLFFLVEKLFDDGASVLPGGGSGRNAGFHTAMFAAILLSCFGPHVLISTFGKSLTLSIALSLTSAYYMLRFTREDKNKYLVFSAVFLGFCAAARLSDALMALPISFLYFSAGRRNFRRVRSFLAFGIIAASTAALYYVPMLLEKGIGPLLNVLTSHSQSQFLGPFSFILRFSLGWLLDLFMMPGVLLIVAGFLFMIFKRLRRQRHFLYVWFLALQFFYGNISSSGPRYLVIAWIPLLIAQASFLGSFKGRRFYLASALVLLIALGDFARFAPSLEFRHLRALQIEFNEWLASKTSADAVIIAVDEGIFIEYYAKRRTLTKPITCKKDEINRFFDEEIDGLLGEGKEVYVVSSALLTYDPCFLFKRMLPERYKVVFIGKKLNEDWHHAFFNRYFFREELYQIKKKT